MPPLDEREFHSYQRERVKLYQDRMFNASQSPPLRIIRKVKKKSNSSIKNGESGNRNRGK